MLSPGATVVLLGDRHTTAPYGLFGGRPGRKARTVLIGGDGETDLGSKEVCRLEAGDIVSFRLAGAGGYGDPPRRDAAALEADVRDGFLSAAAAAEYGAIGGELATRGAGDIVTEIHSPRTQEHAHG